MFPRPGKDGEFPWFHDETKGIFCGKDMDGGSIQEYFTQKTPRTWPRVDHLFPNAIFMGIIICTLWWTNIAMERSNICHGKIHYVYGHFPLLC